MGYYDRDEDRYYNDNCSRYRNAVNEVERRGYVVNSYGGFDDPDKPLRTGGFISSDGTIYMDM